MAQGGAVPEQFTRGEVAQVSSRNENEIVPPTPPHRRYEPSRNLDERPNRSPDVQDAWTPARLTLRPPFDVSRAGEACHELRDGDGVVVAWTPDRATALVLAGLLEAAGG